VIAACDRKEWWACGEDRYLERKTAMTMNDAQVAALRAFLEGNKLGTTNCSRNSTAKPTPSATAR
jgi:hypothetical protein